MILKKPYAFLIKHFRLIHLLLLIPISYLIVKTNAIVNFFRSYVTNNYSTNIVNIAAEHISIFMYLSVLFIIISVIAIYYLMRQKKKTTKLYFFILIYYIVMFVLIGLTFSILTDMEHSLITAQTARAYRDVSFVICLPEYFFFIYTLIRGIGFDIKKFDFANDLKDMEITSIDNEEFEISLNIPGYKAKRTLRRFIRETKYYILENTFVFSCIMVVIIIFIGTVFYLNYGVYNRTYHVSDKMTHNYFNIEIKNSMVTNLDLAGNIITNGKYYLVLQLLIENKTNWDYELDYTNFRLVINDKNYYPILDRGEFFIDLGNPYRKEEIKRKTKDYYVLAYEINEEDLQNTYTIKILEGIDYKIGDIVAKYKNIKLSPTIINSISEIENVRTDKILNLKKSNLGFTTFKVNDYQISNSYAYDYDYCYSNFNCTKLKDLITVDVAGSIEKTKLLILDIDYSLDQNAIYSQVIKNDLQFFSQFFTVRIEKDNKTKIVSLKNRTTKNMQNKVVFETTDEINNASKIELLITNRNNRYVINLK